MWNAERHSRAVLSSREDEALSAKAALWREKLSMLSQRSVSHGCWWKTLHVSEVERLASREDEDETGFVREDECRQTPRAGKMERMRRMYHGLLLPKACFQEPPSGKRTSGTSATAFRPAAQRAEPIFLRSPMARATLFWLLLALACWWLGNAAYIHAKAWLGQALIEHAWQQTQRDQRPARPWPWADTVPIARLSAPALQQETLILQGANGRTIAWGPGWREDSAWPGTIGNSVMVAHRDTHFRFLKNLAVGDRLVIEDARRQQKHYRVQRLRVVDADFALPLETGRAQLTLVTCYPFDALARDNRQRYLVEAVQEEAQKNTSGKENASMEETAIHEVGDKTTDKAADKTADEATIRL